MSNKIADLVFMLKANADQYSAAFGEASESTKKFAKEVEDSSLKSSLSLKNMASFAGGAGLALVGMATGLSTAIMDANREIAQMNNLSASLGINSERFQKLTYAAEQMGVPMEEFGDMLKDVSERITELAEIGTGEAVDMFEKMNIDVREFRGLAPDEMFIKMTEALGTLESKQERNLFLLQIAGDTGQRLSKITDDNGRSFIDLANSMETTSGVLSESMIKESEELNKKLKETSQIVDTSLRNALISATPLVKGMADLYADWAQDVALMFDKMRENPLTDSGLANAILNDQDAVKELKAELKDLQNGKKYGFDWSRFTTNQQAIGEVKAEIDEVGNRLEANTKRYREMRGFEAPSASGSEVKAQGGESSAGTGFINKTTAKSELEARKQQSQSLLDQMDLQYASEREKLETASKQRLEKIQQLYVDEQGLARLGYKTLEEMRKAYSEKELADLDKQKAELAERQTKAVSDGLDRMFDIEQAYADKAKQDFEQVKWIGLDYETEEAQIQSYYDRQAEIVRKYYEQVGGITEYGENLLLEIKKRAEDEKQMYQLQNAQLITSNSASMFGNLATIAENFKGKQSGIYKALFAASRAFAIADIVISTAQGAMRAYRDNPFPLNLVASGAVIAAGAVQLATVRESQVPGYQAGGYTGNKGVNEVAGVVHGKEFVFDAAATARIGVTKLDRIRRGIDEDTDSYDLNANVATQLNSGSRNSVSISMPMTINGNPDDQTLQLIKKAANDGAAMAYQKISGDLATGRGDVSKAVQGGWSVSRRKK